MFHKIPHQICLIHSQNNIYDLDSSDSKDGQEDDDRSCNMEENHNDVLDDFIEQVVEQKVSPNSTDDAQDENNGVNLDGSEDTGSKPPGFESLFKKDASPVLNPKEEEDRKGNTNNVNEKKVEETGDESNGSIPPGFENFATAVKGASSSPSRPRSAKCSTSFGNSKLKDRKGFSFIDEINRMIEVGGALGYDVRGCKRSLRKMINGIGVSKVDK